MSNEKNWIELYNYEIDEFGQSFLIRYCFEKDNSLKIEEVIHTNIEANDEEAGCFTTIINIKSEEFTNYNGFELQSKDEMGKIDKKKTIIGMLNYFKEQRDNEKPDLPEWYGLNNQLGVYGDSFEGPKHFSFAFERFLQKICVNYTKEIKYDIYHRYNFPDILRLG